MGLWNEDFARCECGSGLFEEKKHVVIAKGSPEDAPTLKEVRTLYVCAQCGHLGYSTRENKL